MAAADAPAGVPLQGHGHSDEAMDGDDGGTPSPAPAASSPRSTNPLSASPSPPPQPDADSPPQPTPEPPAEQGGAEPAAPPPAAAAEAAGAEAAEAALPAAGPPPAEQPEAAPPGAAPPGAPHAAESTPTAAAAPPPRQNGTRRGSTDTPPLTPGAGPRSEQGPSLLPWRWFRGGSGSKRADPAADGCGGGAAAAAAAVLAVAAAVLKPLAPEVLHGGCLPDGSLLIEGVLRGEAEVEARRKEARAAAAQGFALRALQRLLPLCSGRRMQPARQEVQQLLAAFASAAPEASSPAAWVRALKHACDTHHPPAVLVALDAFQKLVSFGVVSEDVTGDMTAHAFSLRAGSPPPHTDEGARQPVGLLSEVVAVAAGLPAVLVLNDDGVQLQVLKALLTACTVGGARGWALRMAVRSVFTYSIRAASPVNLATARTVLAQILNSIFAAQLAAAQGAADLAAWQDDAGWIFAHLCGIVQDTELVEGMLPDHSSVRFVHSALSVIHSLLVAGGPGIQHPGLLRRVRSVLLATLLRCLVSPIHSVFEMSLDIFVHLVFHYKHLMKQETGGLFTGAVLKVLNSHGVSPQQQLAVLDALRRIAANAQVLLDIYINYDCGEGTDRVFESMMDTLAILVQGRCASERDQEQRVKRSCLGVMVTVLHSIVFWMRQAEDRMGLSAPGASIGDVERRRKRRALLEEAAAEFNSKPKKGLATLVQHGLLEHEPRSVARFLLESDSLDKGMVGEYLGDPDEFNSMVLVRYCEELQLGGKPLDEAVRNFLSTFTLPKEGQRIERVMEQFAYVWHEMNPQSLRSSESAFLIAVGIVMLNTDLHNPQVEHKMSIEKWVAQFRGANDGEDFPPEMLESIYLGILRNPIRLEHHAALAEHRAAERRPFGLFAARRDRKGVPLTFDGSDVVKRACSKVEGSPARDDPYLVAKDADHVKPFFGVCWAGLLTTFAVLMQEPESEEVVSMCVDGLRQGVHIAAVFEMETVREAFVSTLCKLTRARERKLIEERHVQAIAALLHLARDQGDVLAESWKSVLQTVSALDQLRVSAGRQEQPEAALSPGERIEAENARTVAARIDAGDVAKIFDSSTKLTQVGVKAFVTQLCAVAQEEVNLPTPRMFSLWNVISVALDNMGLRLLGFWKEISALLIRVCTHADRDIAEYGVDSLRRLVMRCVECPDMLSCAVQPELAAPFLSVMQSKAPPQPVRDLVLRCLIQLVLARAPQLKGGWPTVLRTMVAGVQCKPDRRADDAVVVAIRHVLSDDALPHAVPYVGDLVNCLCVAMSRVNSQSAAAELVSACAALPPRVHAVDSELACGTWRRCLEGLVFMTTDSSEALRQHAVGALHGAVTAHGRSWGPELWRVWCSAILVAAVVVPTVHYETLCQARPFTHLRELGISDVPRRAAHEDWLRETLPPLLRSVAAAPVEALAGSSAALRGQLHLLLALLARVAAEGDTDTAKVAVECIGRVLRAGRGLLEPRQWEAAAALLRRLLRLSYVRPSALAAFATPPASDEERWPEDPETPEDEAAGRADEVWLEGCLAAAAAAEDGHEAAEAGRVCARMLLDGEGDDAGEGAVMGRGSAEVARVAARLCSRAERMACLLTVAEAVLLPEEGLGPWLGEDPAFPAGAVRGLLRLLQVASRSIGGFFTPQLSAWRRELREQRGSDPAPQLGACWERAAALRLRCLVAAKHAPAPATRELAAELLNTDAAALLRDYRDASLDATRRGGRDAEGGAPTAAAVLAPVAAAVLHDVSALPPDDFAAAVPALYAPVCQCLHRGCAQFRAEAARFLLRVGEQMHAWHAS